MLPPLSTSALKRTAAIRVPCSRRAREGHEHRRVAIKACRNHSSHLSRPSAKYATPTGAEPASATHQGASATADKAHAPEHIDLEVVGVSYGVQAPFLSQEPDDSHSQAAAHDALKPYKNKAGCIKPYHVARHFFRVALTAPQLDHAARHEYTANIITPLIHHHHHELDAAAVCATVYLLARLGARPGVDTLDLLLHETQYLYPRFQQKTFAVVLWSLAKLGYSPVPRWLTTFLACQCHTLHRASPHDLCISLYALARFRVQPPPTYLAALQDASLAAMPLFSPQDCAMLAWSHSALSIHPGPDIVAALCQHSHHTMPAFTQQSFAVLAYALAALREVPDEPWRAAFFDASLPHVPSATAKNLCLMVAASLTWHHEPPAPWVAATVAASAALLPTMHPQDLAFLIAGVALWGPPPPAAWLALFEARAAQTFDDFTPQTYTSVVFGFARVGHAPHPRFMQQLAARLPAALLQFQPRELSYLMWAFWLLDWTPPPALLSTMLRHALGVAPRLHHKGLRNVLAAAAGWRQVPARWKHEMVGYLQPKLRNHSAEDLASVVASIAALGGCRLPAAWVAEYLQACMMAAPDFLAGELATVLTSLRALNVRTKGAWVGRILSACKWRMLAAGDEAALLALAAAVSESGHVPPSVWQVKLYLKLGGAWDLLGVQDVQLLLQSVGRWLRVDPVTTEDALCTAWPAVGPLPPVAVARLAAALTAAQLAGLRPDGVARVDS